MVQCNLTRPLDNAHSAIVTSSTIRNSSRCKYETMYSEDEKQNKVTAMANTGKASDRSVVRSLNELDVLTIAVPQVRVPLNKSCAPQCDRAGNSIRCKPLFG